jgi:hypothetical protein
MIVPGAAGPVSHHLLKGVGPVFTLKVRAGTKWGTAVLYARKIVNGEVLTESLFIHVKDTRANIFHPTTPHNHQPIPDEQWDKVCNEAVKDPDLGFWLTKFAQNKARPETVANAAKGALGFKPMASWHYDYYLKGFGAVVNEDENLRDWIIALRIRQEGRGNESPVTVSREFNQKSFGTFGDDARLSFGTIDNLEIKADFLLGIVEIWFEDTYEWHPVYSMYNSPRCTDPAQRDTNFLHAACVQMKKKGAKDFQMRGRWTFQMKIFPGL